MLCPLRTCRPCPGPPRRRWAPRPPAPAPHTGTPAAPPACRRWLHPGPRGWCGAGPAQRCPWASRRGCGRGWHSGGRGRRCRGSAPQRAAPAMRAGAAGSQRRAACTGACTGPAQKRGWQGWEQVGREWRGFRPKGPHRLVIAMRHGSREGGELHHPQGRATKSLLVSFIQPHTAPHSNPAPTLTPTCGRGASSVEG